MIIQKNYGDFVVMYNEHGKEEYRWLVNRRDKIIIRLMLTGDKFPNVLVLPNFGNIERPELIRALEKEIPEINYKISANEKRLIEEIYETYISDPVSFDSKWYREIKNRDRITLQCTGNQSILLNLFPPVERGYGRGKVTKIILPKGMKLFTRCVACADLHCCSREYYTIRTPMIANEKLENMSASYERYSIEKYKKYDDQCESGCALVVGRGNEEVKVVNQSNESEA